MEQQLRIGMIGNGSWATALVKILTDNNYRVKWWVRNEKAIAHIKQRRHNPNYLSSAYFEVSLLELSNSVHDIVSQSDLIILALPSSFVGTVLGELAPDAFKGKLVLSAIKGLVTEKDFLINEYLDAQFGFPLADYFTLLGPCHAEEVAAEKLSYLTFSGIRKEITHSIAAFFRTHYINTIVNQDIIGVQYAAVLKNIYALGAGIAHGLEYGDNFLSVYIANSADEMAGFLQRAGIEHIEVGAHAKDPVTLKKEVNYAASVYLGDLLVTCYSLYSRNRTFGAMIGKGYSVQAAQMEMSMVAEGYNAARCIFNLNKKIGSDMILAETIYQILWERLPPFEGFLRIEDMLI